MGEKTKFRAGNVSQFHLKLIVEHGGGQKGVYGSKQEILEPDPNSNLKSILGMLWQRNYINTLLQRLWANEFSSMLDMDVIVQTLIALSSQLV